MKRQLKLFPLAVAGTVLSLCLAACSAPASSTAASSTAESNVQLSNPFIDCADLAEGETLAGFAFTQPAVPEGYAQNSVRAVEGEILDVHYQNGDAKLNLRKATGTGDVSGDFNTYADTTTQTAGAVEVTLRGDAGLVSVASWTDGTYAYAITATPGLDAQTMLDMAQACQ